ncbi:MAG: metallophosphoesterase [Clostridia bacterium]|nr:metallophosphoesterase [Clostridia bacterium]
MKFFTTLALIITLLFQNFALIPTRHGDDVRLKAVLISDIHADADPFRDRSDVLRSAFASIGRTQRDADTIVMSGDLTNSGDFREYVHLFEYLGLYCRIRDRVPEIGNHDSWHHSDDPDYATAERYFKAFCRWNGVKTDTVYYRKQVCGVPFIVLGVEACDFGDPYVSDGQLDWFGRELSSACSESDAVFVICHKPVAKMGACAERLESILTENAENGGATIFYVSGHDHSIGENTFASPLDRLVYLNLPSLLDNAGMPGFVFELKDGCADLTGYSFESGEPLEGFAYHIDI